jgi:hypothetical protein
MAVGHYRNARIRDGTGSGARVWTAVGEGVADVFKLGLVGNEIDGKNIEADRHAGAVTSGKLRQPRCGHAAELAFFGTVDLDFGWKEIARGTGFDLDDDECVSIPGDEVEVTADAIGDPAARDDGVPERAEMEESVVFTALASKEMVW